MLADAQRFLKFAKGTRDDFHEPDEQGIEFRACIGTKLNNTFGECITLDAIEHSYQEVIIILERDGLPHVFNLASLLALAKKGAQLIIEGSV